MKSISKQWLEKYKQTLKCTACGENDVICLSFHHLDPGSKTASLYQLVADRDCTIEQLQKEISKCIVLCYNCHMKYHRDKRDSERFEELSSDLLEEGLYGLWSQDDDGNEGLYN